MVKISVKVRVGNLPKMNLFFEILMPELDAILLELLQNVCSQCWFRCHLMLSFKGVSYDKPNVVEKNIRFS